MNKRGVVVQFNVYNDAYERLLDVFIQSWRENATFPLKVKRIEPPELGNRHASFYWNRKKLDEWINLFDRDTVFLDCDMLMLKDIASGFDIIDYIGIARRTNLPLNGGVIFAKYTKESIEFMEKWAEIDKRMLEDPEFHGPYHDKYAGLNQSSLGYLLENGYSEHVTRIPESYNLTADWEDWENAHLIHLKGQLRRCCIYDRQRGDPDRMRIKEIWKSYASKIEVV